MKKIRGVNFGNWLVLEKWMKPEMFEGTAAEDETWLNRLLEKEKLAPRMKEHRDTYMTEEDFRDVKAHGVNVVRIPVPYFIFNDRTPYEGCIEYLDMAFDWAEKYQLQILVDLHTSPGCQNGYDNGGLCGVCKFGQDPKEVKFVLSVLERLAKRYANRPGLFGIEVLNEPISFWVWVTSPTFGTAVDKGEAKGSWYVPMHFLRKFYAEAYRRLRKILPEDKTIVFHDGFRLNRWNRFFDKRKMVNVMLDTHIYIFAMELFVPFSAMWVYRLFIKYNQWSIARVQKHVPVVVGEWCISCRYANEVTKGKSMTPEMQQLQKKRFLEVAKLQMDAWEAGSGFFYWNYQLLRTRETPTDQQWKEAWDLARCWKRGWMPERFE